MIRSHAGLDHVTSLEGQTTDPVLAGTYLGHCMYFLGVLAFVFCSIYVSMGMIVRCSIFCAVHLRGAGNKRKYMQRILDVHFTLKYSTKTYNLYETNPSGPDLDRSGPGTDVADRDHVTEDDPGPGTGNVRDIEYNQYGLYQDVSCLYIHNSAIVLLYPHLTLPLDQTC